jgi:hypothetical protein
MGSKQARRHRPKGRGPLHRHGPTNQPPAPWLFRSAPTDAEWRSQLAGQTRLTVSAREALDLVREAWRAAVEMPDDQREEGTSPL